MATRFEGDMQPVDSSSIDAIGYDPKRRALVVRFKGGATHLHEGVSADQHAAFMAADSIGRHFVKHIRNQFSSTKL
jgi:hypothetical protein